MHEAASTVFHVFDMTRLGFEPKLVLVALAQPTVTFSRLKNLSHYN